jgi:tripartite-type tricarboxylate transporter receptor subunit TctC
LALIAGSSHAAPAQTDPAASYPNRTVRIVVGFAAGGGNDIIARIVGQKLQEDFGQPVIVENKAGGGGSVAALAVMRAPPDGYTPLAPTRRRRPTKASTTSSATPTRSMSWPTVSTRTSEPDCVRNS